MSEEKSEPSNGPSLEDKIKILREEVLKLEGTLKLVQERTSSSSQDRIAQARELNVKLKASLGPLAQIVYASLGEALLPKGKAEEESQAKTLRATMINYCVTAKIDPIKYTILNPEPPPTGKETKTVSDTKSGKG